MKSVAFTSQNLGEILLNQKAALESFDIPTSLLIFDNCSLTSDYFYNEIITDNTKLRYTTITIVEDLSELNNHQFSKMGTFIFFKERNKVKQENRNRSIWERRFKNDITFQQFHCCIIDGTGAMKASMIMKDGMYALKLGKTSTSIMNVCAFKEQMISDQFLSNVEIL